MTYSFCPHLSLAKVRQTDGLHIRLKSTADSNSGVQISRNKIKKERWGKNNKLFKRRTPPE